MKNIHKKATIKDVAAQAGVSAATVSIVLNGKGETVPESTRVRVRRAAAELGYVPDFAARTLRAKSTRIIGIIVPDISNAFFAELVRRIQVSLAEEGYDIILCNSEEHSENDLKYIRLLEGRRVDGVIWAPSAESMKNKDKIRNALEDFGVPVLFLDRYPEGCCCGVAVDNEKSGYIAVKHLLEFGHTKIGALTGPLCLNSSENRLKGLKRAFAERGLEWEEKYLYEGNYDFESGIRGAQKLLSTDVTAIFAFCDMQAYGVYEFAKRAGRRIPDDLSLIGFDDAMYSALLSAQLTTMKQPSEELAKEACRGILALIGGEKVGVKAELVARLVSRGSVKIL